MTTTRKYKKDNCTSTVLIVVFALVLGAVLLLPYLAGITGIVNAAFLAPDLYAQLPPIDQADTYQKSYDNALLFGKVVKQFYLAFALQFALLLVMAIWAKVLLRRYGKAAATTADSENA